MKQIFFNTLESFAIYMHAVRCRGNLARSAVLLKEHARARAQHRGKVVWNFSKVFPLRVHLPFLHFLFKVDLK